jgi:ABC-type nitrate/sulfonate/bicarbonate transport system substrate-binding protein
MDTVNLIAFAGGFNIPVWIGQRQGLFERRGVRVELAFTPSSTAMIAGLHAGKHDVALASIDNVVAYQEGQGEFDLGTAPDLFAFMGSDSGFLSLVTAPQVKDFAALRGRTLGVDAMTTGFAFVLRELLSRNGLSEADVTFAAMGGTPDRYSALLEGKCAGTILRAPFDLLAQESGCHRLASAGDALGAYMGIVALARRSWAAGHEDAVIGFMRGYRDALAWIAEEHNRAACASVLLEHDRHMTASVVGPAYDIMRDQKEGFWRDVRLDIPGIRTVLRLRSAYARPPKLLDDPYRYIDREFYRKAFGTDDEEHSTEE